MPRNTALPPIPFAAVAARKLVAVESPGTELDQKIGRRIHFSCSLSCFNWLPRKPCIRGASQSPTHADAVQIAYTGKKAPPLSVKPRGTSV